MFETVFETLFVLVAIAAVAYVVYREARKRRERRTDAPGGRVGGGVGDRLEQRPPQHQK